MKGNKTPVNEKKSKFDTRYSSFVWGIALTKCAMVDQKKVEIKICLGSSCFSRGNRTILQEINKYIESKQVKDRVFFHGAHCFGDCNDGPKIEVNGILHCKVNSSMVFDILNEAFGF